MIAAYCEIAAAADINAAKQPLLTTDLARSACTVQKSQTNFSGRESQIEELISVTSSCSNSSSKRKGNSNRKRKTKSIGRAWSRQTQGPQGCCGTCRSCSLASFCTSSPMACTSESAMPAQCCIVHLSCICLLPGEPTLLSI